MKKDIQIARDSKISKTAVSKEGIQISRTGKPISGSIPEILELHFRCSSTGRDFKVLLEKERANINSPYKVTEIIKGGSISHVDSSRLSQAKKLDINISEIQGLSTIKCPFCNGGKSAILKCGCGGLSCGGEVQRKAGRDYHECPWCKSTAIIEGQLETLAGEKHASHQKLTSKDSGQQLRTTIDSVKALPTGSKQVSQQ